MHGLLLLVLGRGSRCSRRLSFYKWALHASHNCTASASTPHPLPPGEWRRARESYLAAAEGFQRAAGFRYGRSTTPRLDGAVFASSNAALMLAQLGDEEGAVREMQAIARCGWAC